MICPHCKHDAVRCADLNAERGEGRDAEMQALETAIDTWANERTRIGAVMTFPDRNLLDYLRTVRGNRRATK